MNMDYMQQLRAKMRKHEQQIAFPDTEEVSASTGPAGRYAPDVDRPKSRLAVFPVKARETYSLRSRERTRCGHGLVVNHVS
jgi:hypothetical protein